jgi:hypothetical protein
MIRMPRDKEGVVSPERIEMAADFSWSRFPSVVIKRFMAGLVNR